MKIRACWLAVFAIAAVPTVWPTVVRAAPGDTELVTVHYAPSLADQWVVTKGISGNGRYVLFSSNTAAFVPPSGISTGVNNVLVRDRSGESTVLANRSTTGRIVNAFPGGISADGRYVTFESDDADVVSGDTNNNQDIFLRDLQASTTELVSVSSTGKQYPFAIGPDVSGDGRYVAFWGPDQMVYLRDRLTRQTYERYVAGLRVIVHVSDDGRYLAYSNYERMLVLDRSTNKVDLVNVNAAGQRANDHCYLADLSADGRFVLFGTRASNLVPGDTNGTYDIFIRDRTLRRTERVSVTNDEKEFADIPNYVTPRMSADGRYVAFTAGTRSVPGIGVYDVFRRDRAKGTTWLATANSEGVKANDTSFDPLVSDDGRFVAFTSQASNLSPSDGDRGADAYVHQFHVAPLPSPLVHESDDLDFGTAPILTGSAAQAAPLTNTDSSAQ